jgi:hypothetical protein
MSFPIEIVIAIPLLTVMISILWSTVRYGISPMPSNSLAKQGMLSLIPNQSPDIFIDLGSGWGRFAYQLARQYPHKTVVGYERSLFPFLFSKFCFRQPNLQFKFVNFLHQEYPQNSLMFSYLYPKGMLLLAKHLQGQNCWLISNTFSLPNHQPTEKLQLNDTFHSHIYLYRFTQSQD